MANEEILLGILTLADSTQYFFADSTYVGDVPAKGGKGFTTTIFYGDIPEDKPIAWSKEMGFFVWGKQSKQTVGDLWLMNESLSKNGKGPGRYDDLLFAKPTRNAKLEYFIVNDGESFSTATPVGVWLVDDVRNPDENFIVISVADKLSKIDKNTPHEYFSDTLPYVENRNQPRPILIGFCNHIPVPLVDSVNNIFEMYAESDYSLLSAVYDNADPFSFPADYSHAVQFTGGYGFDLNNPFIGVVTCNARGPEFDPTGENAISNRFPGFVKRLLVDYGEIPVSEIDSVSLSAINTEFNFRYGVYIQDGSNMRDILEHSMVGHCGYVYQDNEGIIKFNWVKPPNPVADHVLDEINIASEGIKIRLDGAEGLSDSAATRKNWFQFTYDQIKDVGITEDEKLRYSREYQNYIRSSTTTSGGDAFHETYAHARHGDHIKTLCNGVSHAERLISHLENELYDEERHFHEFSRLSPSARYALSIEIGETMELNDPRLFPSGKNTLITNIKGKSMKSKIIEFESWG